MGEKQTVFLFLGIFLITHLLGLYVGNRYNQAINRAIESGELEERPGIVEGISAERVENSFYLFGYIIIVTLIILLVIKFWRNFLKLLEAFAIFFSSWITFDFLIPISIWYVSLGFFLAILLTAWKMLRPTILSQNIAVIFTIAGVGAFIGASLGILPVLIFMLLLTIYDFVSVFVTKHMVHLAKEITKRPTAFVVSIPHKFKKAVSFSYEKKKGKKKIHVFQLGAGDIAIPLMFSVSVLSSYSFVHGLLTSIGSVVALGILIFYLVKKPGIALPAIPFITLGSVGGFLASLLFI